MLRKLPLSTALILLLLPLAAEGQEPTCKRDGSETFIDCFQRVMSESASKASKSNIAQAAQPAQTPETQGASKDFLSRLFTSLGFGDFSEDETSQTLSFNLTPTAQKNKSPEQTVLKFVRHDAVLFESLVNQIPEAIRADRKETLTTQLQDFDDFEISLSVAVEGKLFGRYFGRGFDSYASDSDAVFAALAPAPNNIAMQKLLRISQGIGIGGLVGMDVQNALANHPSEAAEFEPALIEAAKAEAAGQQAFHGALKNGGYFDLGKLVGNQPQLHFEGNYRVRDDLVGPDKWKIKGTYEHGFGNLNGARRYASKHCSGILTGAYQGGTCLTEFLTERKGHLKSSNRFSASLEIGQADSLRFELPDDDFLFTLDDVESVIGSLTYGRTLTVDNKGVDASRFDFAVSYEDVSGDAMRDNRLVATGTFTQNIINGQVVSLSLVYASEPEYLGEVDEELSARLGLKFKLDKKDKQ